MEKRLLQNYGSLKSFFASEDGRHYRQDRQELKPVFDYVKQRHETINEQGDGRWRSVGTIPMTVLMEWLQENHYTIDQWARNEDNAKKKFIKHIRSREYHKLFAPTERL